MSRTQLNDLSVETTLSSTETLEIVGGHGFSINLNLGRGGRGRGRFDRPVFRGPRRFDPRFDRGFGPRRRPNVIVIPVRRPIRFRP